jgi:hypothetical protein
MVINRNKCVYKGLQLLQILFTDFTAFAIAKLSQHHLQSEYLDVDSFQIESSTWASTIADAQFRQVHQRMHFGILYHHNCFFKF